MKNGHVEKGVLVESFVAVSEAVVEVSVEVVKGRCVVPRSPRIEEPVELACNALRLDGTHRTKWTRGGAGEVESSILAN